SGRPSRRVVIARGDMSLPEPRPGKILVKLTRKDGRLLKKLRTLRMTLRIALSDHTGRRTTVSRGMVLRR
ncbi:MAG: hypothetical protein M3355_04100, partial [Actinomycetota bacterium]|nr:hypothetical protein [Actinomycetota bacterium]